MPFENTRPCKYRSALSCRIRPAAAAAAAAMLRLLQSGRLLLLLLLRWSRSAASKMLPKTPATPAVLLLAPAATLTLIDAQPRNTFKTHFPDCLLLQRWRHWQTHDGGVIVSLLHLRTRVLQQHKKVTGRLPGFASAWGAMQAG